MPATDIKGLIHRLVEEVWNKGNLALIDELRTPEAIFHNPGMPDVIGSEAFKQVVMMYRTAFPDLHFTIEEVIVEGNTSAARWVSGGTHHGELMGIPPTGKNTSISGIYMAHFQDGKVSEEWSRWDTLHLLQQLGVMPAQGE